MQKNPSYEKGNILIFLLVGILILAATGGAFYLGRQTSPKIKACTMDAKVCSDGSSVGRTGPNCEFAPCPSPLPTSSDETNNWKIYMNSKNLYSFKYPSNFYIDESNTSEDGYVYNRVTIENKTSKDFYDNIKNNTATTLNPDDKETFLMSIVIPPYKENMDLEIAKKQYDVPANKAVDYTIGGFKGFRVINGDTVIVYKGQEYYFQLRNYDNKYANYFDQILSTFKFTQ